MFSQIRELESCDMVTLGDGSTLQITEEGTVDVDIILNNGTKRSCALKKVLYVPRLAYSLVSVSKAVDAGKTVHFEESMCKFWNECGEVMQHWHSRWGPVWPKVRKAAHRV